MELLTRAEYSRRRGCSQSLISREVQNGRIPLHDGKINPEEADRILDRRSESDADGAPDYWAEHARLEKLKADKAALEVAKLHGELIEVDVVKETWTKHVAAARARLLALPRKIAPIVKPLKTTREIEAAIKLEVYEALTELSTQNNDEQKPATRKKNSSKPARRRGADVGTAAGAKRRAVGRAKKSSKQ